MADETMNEMCVDGETLIDAPIHPEIVNYDDLLSDHVFMRVLLELLKDRTTGKNIVWATDTYDACGRLYGFQYQMTVDTVVNIWGTEFKPRVSKNIEQI